MTYPTGPTPPDETPLLGAVPPGSVADRKLRDALATLREQAPDEQTARLYDDILAGRRSARDLLESPGFAAAASQGVEQYRTWTSDLDDEQRAELDEAALVEADHLTDPAGPA